MQCLCTGRSDIVCNETGCSIAGPGEAGNPNQCRLCWLRLRGGRRTALCQHLGTPTGETRDCRTCGGHKGVQVRRCEVHGRCTRTYVEPSLMSCGVCRAKGAGWEPKDTSEPAAAQRRHLLFHVYPLEGSTWMEHALRLGDVVGSFNGAKVLAVAVDENTVPIAEVRRRFLYMDSVVEVPNQPTLREVASHAALFGAVSGYIEPGDATLWAHAKGVTRHGNRAVAKWVDALYRTVGDVGRATAALRLRPLVGSFLKRGPGWPKERPDCLWHYSGSWFWFRNRDLFQRDWRGVHQFWAGMETYPSLHFDEEEAGVLFAEGKVPELNLYSMGAWDRLAPELNRWIAAST